MNEMECHELYTKQLYSMKRTLLHVCLLFSACEHTTALRGTMPTVGRRTLDLRAYT